jgi:hypothetical protein
MARKYGNELDTDGDGDFDLVFTGDDEEKPRMGSAVAGATRRVRAIAPFQVVYNQVVYRPDDVAEVPESVAADWVRDGWVELAE